MPDRRANSRFSKNASFKARLSNIWPPSWRNAPAGHLINLITHLVLSNQGWFDNTKWYQIRYQITEIRVQATSELYSSIFPSVKTCACCGTGSDVHICRTRMRHRQQPWVDFIVFTSVDRDDIPDEDCVYYKNKKNKAACGRTSHSNKILILIFLLYHLLHHRICRPSNPILDSAFTFPTVDDVDTGSEYNRTTILPPQAHDQVRT